MDDSSYTPTVEEVCKALHVEKAEAEELRTDKDKLLRRLKKAIDRLNEEEDDELAMLEAMGSLGGGFGGGLGGKGDGKGGFGGLLGAMGGGLDLEAMLGAGLD